MSGSPVVGRRSAGVLLHLSSLPSPHGIGDLGPAAYAWVDLLARTGQSWWQVLPVSATGAGDSPYQSLSSTGGNPLLISPELLVEDGLLQPADLAGQAFPAHEVDYDAVRRFKARVLEQAWARFHEVAASNLRTEFETFLQQNATWIDEYALFMAIKEARGGAAWFDWPNDLRMRDPSALALARRELAGPIARFRFEQFLAFRQWVRLKRYANEHGLRIIGDLPIFVSDDSLDVWLNPEQFLLDANHRPRFVAGVPPDYFSPTGQHWGNPLYDWEAMAKDGYAWWIRRLRGLLRYFDVVRLDHFRGFEAAWHIPAGAPTAQHGHWEPGPGDDLLGRLREALGDLRLIAEDLGQITPAVRAMRDRFGLPGMRVLQFAFDGDPQNPFLPHNYERNTVAYTGTHDNDTTVGWYRALAEPQRHIVRTYSRSDGRDIAWDLIHLAWSSVADLAVVPVQDLLMLDSSARMNRPNVALGNWRWRLASEQPVERALERLAGLTKMYNRWPDR